MRTLGIVWSLSTVAVLHSAPSGVRSLWSCCAADVYGNGKSFRRYLAAFLSFFSLMMTFECEASLRSEAAIPGILVMNFLALRCFLTPLPDQAP